MIEFEPAAGLLVERLLARLLLVTDATAAYRLALDWPPGFAAAAPDGVVVHSGGVVELHGGEVRAASDGEGHGATFSVTLPVLSTVTPDLALAPGPSPTGGEASASSPLPPTTSSGE